MTQSQIPSPKPQKSRSVIGHRLLVIGLLLFAFALRLYRLNAQSIWVDEGISLHLATSSLSEIIANRAANIHPPLYFLLLKVWVALTGTDIFSARFFSAMASLLQVAAIYAVVRRWLGRAAACVAASLTVLSPLSVIYAQEIRTYALLPLIYLALLATTHRLTQKSGPHRGATWLNLGIVEVIGLHLHYTALFLVTYTGAWSLLTFWKKNRRADLRRWLVLQLLVGLVSLPWLVAILAHWSAVQAEAQAGATLAQPPPLGHLLTQIWVFHLTGLAGAMARPTVQLWSSLTFLILAMLLLLRFVRPTTRPPVARLLAHWLIPLSAALLVWIVRPFSHPRYLILYAPGLTLVATYAICAADDGQPNTNTRLSAPVVRPIFSILQFALTTSLVLISLLGLGVYFFDPTSAKDDVRGVARYLEKETEPSDLILVTDGDWSLTFAYQGAAPIEMPGVADEERMWTNLARWTTFRRRVFVMSYQQGIGGDPREVIPFALEKAGTLHARQRFENILVRLYQLDRPVEPPTLSPVGAYFGPLLLTHSWAEIESPADTALTLALRWHSKEATDHPYGLKIRLLDVDGWPLSTRANLLLDGQARPTNHWPAGREITTYHILRIPPGTPPLTYTLNLGLYEQTASGPRALDLLDDRGAPHGQWLDLANVRLTDPLGLTDSIYGTTSSPPPLQQPAALADGLWLLGAELDRPILSPGQSVFVTLHWQATLTPLPDLRPRLALIQADQELSIVESAPALGRYPTDRWQAGETVIEHRRLVAPPTAEGGPADVVLSIGDQQLVLGQIEISAEAHIFTPPPISYPLDIHFGQVARLIGYDLPSQALEGTPTSEPITLTLYWQALEGATVTDYTVFTHILATDGHLVGQHDGPPVGGARPTLGWVPGEIIADQHPMTFRESSIGPVRIEVGLYNPVTMERVAVEGDKSFILLPTTLTILER